RHTSFSRDWSSDVCSSDLGVWVKGTGQLKTSCPFPDHPDASPSFSVNLDRMVWKCHGCGRAGNHITLVAQMEGIGNAEARARIEIGRASCRENVEIYGCDF